MPFHRCEITLIEIIEAAVEAGTRDAGRTPDRRRGQAPVALVDPQPGDRSKDKVALGPSRNQFRQGRGRDGRLPETIRGGHRNERSWLRRPYRRRPSAELPHRVTRGRWATLDRGSTRDSEDAGRDPSRRDGRHRGLAPLPHGSAYGFGKTFFGGPGAREGDGTRLVDVDKSKPSRGRIRGESGEGYLDRLAQLAAGPSRTCPAGGNLADDPVHQTVVGGQNAVVLASELGVQGSRRHSGQPGQLPHRHTAVAALGDQLGDRAMDPSSLVRFDRRGIVARSGPESTVGRPGCFPLPNPHRADDVPPGLERPRANTKTPTSRIEVGIIPPPSKHQE
ncbi:MAG: hypothetical protein JWO14_3909 [Solirubrobacterales bacterium]|nr:hypothetical protein [Solirubrobacterales bacterium]